jgi:hypothetical protein
LPNKRNTFIRVIKVLFKRLFDFFLFRIRRHGFITSKCLCRPSDIYHWWNWLSGKAAAAETATVMTGYWAIVMCLREKRGQSCRERLFNILSRAVSVTWVSVPMEARIIFSFIFRNWLRRKKSGGEGAEI